MLNYVPLHDPKRLAALMHTELSQTGGRWLGAGAQELGLNTASPVEAEVFTRLYTRFLDPRHPDPADEAAEDRARLGRRQGRYVSEQEHLDRLRRQDPGAAEAEVRAAAKQATRKVLLCIDLTYTPVKSISVAHAAFQARARTAEQRGAWDEAHAWQGRAARVRAAVVLGNQAMLDLMNDIAGLTRAGAGGKRLVPGHGWVIARFLRAWSLARDPNLYVRNLVLNRVHCQDGVWRSPDSAAVRSLRAWGAAVAERATMEDLSISMGLAFHRRADCHGFEVVGIDPAVLTEFSSRSRSIDAYLDRRPTPNDSPAPRSGKARHFAATYSANADRAAYRHRAPADLVDWWEQRLAQAGLRPLSDLADVLIESPVPSGPQAGRVEVRAAQHAVAHAGRRQPRDLRGRAELALALNNHLPAYLGGLGAEEIRALLADAVSTYTAR